MGVRPPVNLKPDLAPTSLRKPRAATHKTWSANRPIPEIEAQPLGLSVIPLREVGRSPSLVSGDSPMDASGAAAGSWPLRGVVRLDHRTTAGNTLEALASEV